MSKQPSVKELLTNSQLINQHVTVQGWVRTRRGNKNVAFIQVNDGSCFDNIQVVADPNVFDEDLMKSITTGASIVANGKLVESGGKGQSVEIQAASIEVPGSADSELYPLQKKGHTLEFLREKAHLRFRTNTFGAVFRIRHTVAFAIHEYFNNHGFYYLNTPIITGSDAEGAGETFTVTNKDVSKGITDFSDDFFGRHAKLTVSGQLEGELGALALGKIYTFGPTFRAENSNTPRHLAEFWMIEPEMAFYDLDDNINLAEDFLKYIVSKVIEKHPDEIAFLEQMYDKELTAKLKMVTESRFERVSYTKAVELLSHSNQKFEFPVSWGIDLQSEHERWLVEKHFKKPVVVYNYPKDIKAFYMRLNDDGKTVGAVDILFPGVGEIIGGSQREERLDYLEKRMDEMNVPKQELWWYLDTRRFGSVVHSGFGLGLERLVLFCTGMKNIRDVIPFPRTPKNAEF